MYGPMQGAQDVLYVKTPDDQSVLAQLRDFSGVATAGSVKTVTPDRCASEWSTRAPCGARARRTRRLRPQAGFLSGGTGVAAHPVDNTQVRYAPGAITQGELLLQYLARPLSSSRIPRSRAPMSKCSRQGLHLDHAPEWRRIGERRSLGRGTPQAVGPSSTDSAGDSYANGSGGVNPAQFGPPIPKGPRAIDGEDPGRSRLNDDATVVSPLGAARGAGGAIRELKRVAPRVQPVD